MTLNDPNVHPARPRVTSPTAGPAPDLTDAELRVELSRLRGVVEAVQAVRRKLPHGLDGEIESEYQRGYDHASDDIARRLDAALAPVSSSGEAESGEAAPGGWLCRHGKYRSEHWCDDHLDHERRMQTTAPAPVPSGGQADGEGVRLTDAEWREFQRLPEEGYSHRAWVDAAIARRLAARPVLSREALRDPIAQALHAWDVEGGPCEGPWDGLTDHQREVWLSGADAVLDVVAGGEQRG